MTNIFYWTNGMVLWCILLVISFLGVIYPKNPCLHIIPGPLWLKHHSNAIKNNGQLTDLSEINGLHTPPIQVKGGSNDLLLVLMNQQKRQSTKLHGKAWETRYVSQPAWKHKRVEALIGGVHQSTLTAKKTRAPDAKEELPLSTGMLGKQALIAFCLFKH